ncbi:MAG: glycosyltransferase family 2 protein [Niabella sp.]
MSFPLVAIVILNWNGRKYLENFLPDVLRSMYANYRVIVADNGSTDDSVLFLKEHYPEVEIILLPENYGFAKGYNLALAGVEADYYVLLNSDVKVEPGWLEPMVALAEQDKNIAACQPKLLSYKHPQYFEYAGAAGGWLDYYGYPFARGRVFDLCESDEGQYNNAVPIFWASGAAMFIRASVFHEVGGFDNYFFAHQEEIDLCWRIQLAGYSIYSCPASVVYHIGGGTLPKGNSLKTYLNFRNNHIMMYKNMKGIRKYAIILFRIMLDAASAFKSLLAGDGGYFVAVVSAHLSFVKWVFMKQKESVFPKSRKGELNGYWRGNMVWQHFVRGKKKFSQIVAKEE